MFKLSLYLKSLTLATIAIVVSGSSISLAKSTAKDSSKDIPVIIDDMSLTKELADEIGKFAAAKKTIPSKVLLEQLKSRTSAEIELPASDGKELADLYSERVGSVGIIASVFKCKRCPDWHRSSCATCWVLTADGIMVTNYHVFKVLNHEGFGVLTQDGKVAPVTEILAADEEQDIAIFRVEGKGYKPIPLGKAQKVGGNTHIIAHPDGNFFTYSSGKVSRYCKDKNNRPVYWMCVTAEYARGSSGGPVMDDCGNAIGMVSSTYPIHYFSKDKSGKKKSFQMIVRSTVPVDAIRKLIKKP